MTMKMAIEIVEFPIKNGDFPWLCKRLLEGNHEACGFVFVLSPPKQWWKPWRIDHDLIINAGWIWCSLVIRCYKGHYIHCMWPDDVEEPKATAQPLCLPHILCSLALLLLYNSNPTDAE